ncbi:MAG: hypothetical protein ACI8RD_013269 [Bacillariaceae sp.]|jgi:hypothetical protein
MLVQKPVFEVKDEYMMYPIVGDLNWLVEIEISGVD